MSYVVVCVREKIDLKELKNYDAEINYYCSAAAVVAAVVVADNCPFGAIFAFLKEAISRSHQTVKLSSSSSLSAVPGRSN